MNVIADRYDESRDQVHALVIGVGHYLHLEGGALHARWPSKYGEAMGQLTSPVASARAFVGWLLERHSNPSCPLGSVELLASPDPLNVEPEWTGTERPTVAGIETGFNAWEKRCDARPGNIAMFYFSGHGLDGGTSLLLAEDFGANRNTPWSNAIDFNATKVGMRACRARTQVYVLDCCRESPLELQTESMIGAKILKTASTFQRDPTAVVLRAAPAGESTGGEKNAVSDFTNTVLRCLNDFGATQRFGKTWAVTTHSLPLAVTHCGTALDHQPRSPECSGPEERTFHEITGRIPSALVEVTVIPALALAKAELTLNGAKTYTRDPKHEPWLFEADAGEYRLGASFVKPSPHTDADEPLRVYPPWQTRELQV